MVRGRGYAKSAADIEEIVLKADLPGVDQKDIDLRIENSTLTVRGEKSEEVHSVDVNYENFVNDIAVGDVVLLDNGAMANADQLQLFLLGAGDRGHRLGRGGRGDRGDRGDAPPRLPVVLVGESGERGLLHRLHETPRERSDEGVG